MRERNTDTFKESSPNVTMNSGFDLIFFPFFEKVHNSTDFKLFFSNKTSVFFYKFFYFNYVAVFNYFLLFFPNPELLVFLLIDDEDDDGYITDYCFFF